MTAFTAPATTGPAGDEPPRRPSARARCDRRRFHVQLRTWPVVAPATGTPGDRCRAVAAIEHGASRVSDGRSDGRWRRPGQVRGLRFAGGPAPPVPRETRPRSRDDPHRRRPEWRLTAASAEDCARAQTRAGRRQTSPSPFAGAMPQAPCRHCGPCLSPGSRSTQVPGKAARPEPSPIADRSLLGARANTSGGRVVWCSHRHEACRAPPIPNVKPARRCLTVVCPREPVCPPRLGSEPNVTSDDSGRGAARRRRNPKRGLSAESGPRVESLCALPPRAPGESHGGVRPPPSPPAAGPGRGFHVQRAEGARLDSHRGAPSWARRVASPGPGFGRTEPEAQTPQWALPFGTLGRPARFHFPGRPGGRSARQTSAATSVLPSRLPRHLRLGQMVPRETLPSRPRSLCSALRGELPVPGRAPVMSVGPPARSATERPCRGMAKTGRRTSP